MSKKGHSPLPFKISGFYKLTDKLSGENAYPILWSEKGTDIAYMTEGNPNFESDAKFIVRACNTYYEHLGIMYHLLVMVLQMHHGGPNAVIQKAEELLTEAKLYQ